MNRNKKKIPSTQRKGKLQVLENFKVKVEGKLKEFDLMK